MEDQVMDARTKTVIATFLALLGVLAISVVASANHARPNTALSAAIFGTSE